MGGGPGVRAQHHQAQVAGLVRPEGADDGRLAGPAVELDHRVPSGLPQGGAGPERLMRRAARAARRGSGGHRQDQYRHGPGAAEGELPVAPAGSCRGARRRRRAAAHDPDGGGRGGQQGEVQRAEPAQRPACGRGGDAVEPGEEHTGGQVERGGERSADHAGDQPGGETPDHERAGHRDRQEVGGDRRHRHAAEGRHQQRGDGDLGRQRHRQGRGQPPGSGQRGRQPARADDDAGGAGHRQAEAERGDQQRVDQHHPGHAQRQGPQRRRRPADGGADGGDGGHGGGPQHRRLAPGEQREARQHPERGHEAGAEPQPAQQRGRDDQGERHVLARYSQEMGEAGGPEGVRHVGGLVAVVAQGHPGQQAAVPFGERHRAVCQRPAQAVGGAGDGIAGPPAGDGLDLQPAGEVAVSGPGLVVARRPDRADDRDPLAHQAVVEAGGRGVAGVGGQAAAVEPDVGGRSPAAVGHRVAHQRHLGPDRARGQRCHEPVERALRQAGGQQPGRQHQRLGPEPAEAPQQPRQPQHGEASCQRNPGQVAIHGRQRRHPGHDGQDHRPAVRHRSTAPDRAHH
jgi:hypothetical protein